MLRDRPGILQRVDWWNQAIWRNEHQSHPGQPALTDIRDPCSGSSNKKEKKKHLINKNLWAMKKEKGRYKNLSIHLISE